MSPRAAASEAHPRRRRSAAAAAASVLCAVCAVACGTGADDGEHTESSADDCVVDGAIEAVEVGSARDGAAGVRFELVQLVPEPPARFENTWVVGVTAPAGAVGDDAVLSATPWMPAHQHGPGRAPVVTPQGNGLFEIAPLDLWMPGHWEIRLQLESAELGDAVTFDVCIPD